MADFDVLVVGGRCAGSTLATLLARGGLRVGVVERATFPSDTHSTHVMQSEGINVLDRLGVLDQLLEESGSPLIHQVSFQVDDLVYRNVAIRPREGDRGQLLNVRRTIIDTVLHRACKEAGADVMDDTIVRDLVWADGRVSGVRVEGPGGERSLTARLVVGADGASSTVGRLVGARRYHVREFDRIAAWAYYEGVPEQGEPDAYLGFHHGDIALRSPGDSGLHLVIAIPEQERARAFRADPQAEVEAYLRPFDGMARIIDEGRLHGDVRIFKPPTMFMRESAGPGWVLVGDAGHFKDPTPGQGMSDAFRQAEHLADALLAAFGGVLSIDTTTHRWWRWRDDDAFEKHHWAADLGRGGPAPALVAAMIGDLARTREGQEGLTAVFQHRVKPSEVLTPVRASKVAGALLLGDRVPRRQVVQEFGSILRDELQRRRERKRPVYADPEIRRAPPAERAVLRSEAVTIGGLRLPVLEGGGDGPEAVVFVHGNPGSGADFEPVASQVASFARVIAPDLPGFGSADKPDPADFDYRIQNYARVLGELLDARGVQRAHLVLHDFGGPWGLEWATLHPERVASVCMTNTGTLLGYRWHALARLWQQPGIGEAFMASANRTMFGLLSNVGMTRKVPDADLDRMWADFDPATRRAVLALYRNSSQIEIGRLANRWARALRPLDLPALVIWGAEDLYVPDDQAARERAVFPDAEVAVLDDSGHFPFADDPEGYAAALVPWLRRRGQDSGHRGAKPTG